MNKQEFNEIYQKYLNKYCENFDKNKSSINDKYQNIANGLRIMSKLAFNFKNESFYFNIGQVEITLNNSFFFFIKEIDINNLVNNNWKYNQSTNTINYGF